MTKSPATCWNVRHLIDVIIRGRCTGQTVDETMLPRRRANKSQPSRCDIFPTGRVVSAVGTRGPGRGVSGARRRLRHEGWVQEGERGEGNKRESCWKSGKEQVRLYTWRRTGPASSDAITGRSGRCERSRGHETAWRNSQTHILMDQR
jgi:hypothetical protein